MTYQILLSYDGKKYKGWQKQLSTSNTIQEKLETMLSRMYGEPIEVHGAGRTDAGVHAISQSASFQCSALIKDFENEVLQMNEYLPEDIRILTIIPHKDRFHARLNAKGKHYQYRIYRSNVLSPFERNYAYQVTEELSLEKMKEAANLLVGTHDFKAFCSNHRMKKSSVRTIHKIELTQKENLLTIDYYGTGFLHHMIRIITGTLLEVGAGRMEPSTIPEIIESKERAKAGPLVPGKGLFLVEVVYDYRE